MSMIVVDHEEQQWEEWRPGVYSRAWATASTGALQVRIAEQRLDPGTQAPTHWHYFEENITVVAGEAEIWVEDERRRLGSGNTVIVHATKRHGFESVGDEPLHVVVSMSWPINEINYDGAEAGTAYRAGELVNGGARRKVGTVPGRTP
jgi:quercetin dioxygenase-like cupin family protein